MKSKAALKDKIFAALELMAEHGHPTPGAARLLDVGNTAYLAYFEEEVLENLVARGGATCRFIEGAYGAGKTHLLTAITEMALEKGYAVANSTLDQATLSLEDWDRITAHIFAAMTAVIGGVEVKSLPAILAQLGRQPRFDPKKLAHVNLPHPGFRNAMLYALTRCNGNDVAFNLVSTFLRGQKVTAGEFKRQGLVGIKNPLSKRNAELVLKTVLTGLYNLGLPGTVLTFDECEKTLVYKRNPPPARVLNAAKLMRRLVDGGVTGLLCGAVSIFAVLPGFLEECNILYPALGQRLQLVRGPGYRAWRWPVLPIDKVCSTNTAEEYLDEAIKTLSSLVATCGGDRDKALGRMREQGQRVLAVNAGQGYRRGLMRALAAEAVKYI